VNPESAGLRISQAVPHEEKKMGRKQEYHNRVQYLQSYFVGR
jgi:hypothetical protein